MNMNRIKVHIAEQAGIEVTELKSYVLGQMEKLGVGEPHKAGNELVTGNHYLDSTEDIRNILGKFETSYPHHLPSMNHAELMFLYKLCIGSAFNRIVYDEEREPKVYEGFTATYHCEEFEEFHTAQDGNFDHGFTTLDEYFEPGIVGRDDILTHTIEQIDKHRKELVEEKKVLNIHFQWTLTEDRRDYATVKVIRTELVDMEEE